MGNPLMWENGTDLYIPMLTEIFWIQNIVIMDKIYYYKKNIKNVHINYCQICNRKINNILKEKVK